MRLNNFLEFEQQNVILQKLWSAITRLKNENFTNIKLDLPTKPTILNKMVVF